MTYRECYLLGCEKLKEADIAEYELDARLLLEYVCDTNYNTLLLEGNLTVSKKNEESFLAAIEKRQKHIPLQYITGKQDFFGMTSSVNEHVLIPRQDTDI